MIDSILDLIGIILDILNIYVMKSGFDKIDRHFDNIKSDTN